MLNFQRANIYHMHRFPLGYIVILSAWLRCRLPVFKRLRLPQRHPRVIPHQRPTERHSIRPSRGIKCSAPTGKLDTPQWLHHHSTFVENSACNFAFGVFWREWPWNWWGFRATHNLVHNVGHLTLVTRWSGMIWICFALPWSDFRFPTPASVPGVCSEHPVRWSPATVEGAVPATA